MVNKTLAIVVLLLFLAGAPTTESLSYFQYQTPFSLSHSLLTRVANLRAARGDYAGANRARTMAAKLEPATGMGFWRLMWSAGWDYVRNYAWRDLGAYSELIAAVSDANELLSWLGELTRFESDSERVAWVGRSYHSVLRVSRSLLARLLNVFRQSGTLREVVETVQREVVDGGLLRDCLELGSNDLKGLIQILKDLGLQFVSTPDKSHADF
ncbi:hypothetical protein L484_015610 [Morus notabilis]|uniref:Uncharacterized protein n=1 Tax=Morus notabilis TaxID=981085 RepID=W9RLB2_9ROSA|nr:uncharacterized protein LOC21398697 [Morus notabilis]EXB58277.1 hypothetical protein L484_015610 [Morus notabilis]